MLGTKPMHFQKKLQVVFKNKLLAITFKNFLVALMEIYNYIIKHLGKPYFIIFKLIHYILIAN